MAPPPVESSVDKKQEKTAQNIIDEKFRRTIQKRRKVLKDFRRRSTSKRKLVAKEVRTTNLLYVGIVTLVKQ